MSGTDAGPSLAQIIMGSNYVAPTNQRLHATKAKDSIARLYKASEGLAKQFADVAAISDPKLSAEGIEAARAEGNANVLQQLHAVVKNARADADLALGSADLAAQPFRPKFDPYNVAQIARSDSAWTNSVRPQLESGRAWHGIIGTLDVDGLVAVQRLAPAHEASKRDRWHQDEVPPVLATIADLASRRAVEIAPEGEARDALLEHADVVKFHKAAHTAAAALESVRAPRDATGATIVVKRTTFEVGAQPTAQVAAA